MSPDLQRLNAVSREEAETALLACCGSLSWARLLAGRRPFRTPQELYTTAENLSAGLGRDDWLEAFSRHPKIGEQKAAHAAPPPSRSWSEQEQAVTRAASPEALAELAEANRLYEARFGYIFIVCATGKSAGQMLALLRQRLQNDPETELRAAAEEQRRIARLRLEKLVAG